VRSLDAPSAFSTRHMSRYKVLLQRILLDISGWAVCSWIFIMTSATSDQSTPLIYVDILSCCLDARSLR